MSEDNSNILEQKEASKFVIIATLWGVVLFFLALILPVVTPQTSVIDPNLPAGPSNDSTKFIHIPQITLVSQYGYSVLILVSIPIVISILVGLLLRFGVRSKISLAISLAWILSGAVLLGGIIGFLTILFTGGLAIVPIGVFLLLACQRTRPFKINKETFPI